MLAVCEQQNGDGPDPVVSEEARPEKMELAKIKWQTEKTERSKNPAFWELVILSHYLTELDCSGGACGFSLPLIALRYSLVMDNLTVP